MNVLFAIAAGFLVTVIAILALRPIALTLDLVDRPGGRKTHHGDVPLVGGLAMFLGIVVALGLMNPPPAAIGPLVAVFALMVVIGMLDDRFSISHWMRLVVHLAAAAALVMGTGVIVHTIGNPFGTGAVWFSSVGAFVFTVLVIAATINSFNMLDGMDGLAGIVALVTVMGLAYLASQWGEGGVDVAVCGVIGAAITGFLIFNVPSGFNRPLRCFMGDAGSTLIGVAIAWLGIRVSQAPVHGVSHPVTVLWIASLPLFELFWSVIRRVLRGRSPMKADSDHFHHLLTRAGLSVRVAFLCFMLLDALLVITGLVLNALGVPDWGSLLLLLVAGALVVRSMYGAGRIAELFPGAVRSTRAADQ